MCNNINPPVRLQLMISSRFLLAQLHLESLANSQTANEVRNSLNTLPKALDPTYDNVMARIKAQDSQDSRLAKKVLSWIIYAKRPLTIEEMQHAAKTEPGVTRTEQGDLISKDILVSVCAGIVTIDKEANTIRLVHYSTQEYFMRTRNTYFPNAEEKIATACMTYLMFEEMQSLRGKDGRGLRRAMKLPFQRQAFLWYAAEFWNSHISEITESILETALKFLANGIATRVSFAIIQARRIRYMPIVIPFSDYGVGMSVCLCSYIGAHSLLEKLPWLQENINYSGYMHGTPRRLL